MKHTSPPIFLNKITDEVVIEILNALIPTFNELEINYFIVGAFARDAELLAKGFDEPPSRKTRDLDLAVMLTNEEEFEQLKEKLTDIDGFELHNTEPIKLIYNDRYEVDLLPFGEIVNEKGIVELRAKRGFTLDMPGFSEVFNDVQSIETDQGFQLNVCPISGVVLLKLIAWNDRKERNKDIQDIEYIIRNLYLLEVEEMAENHDDLFDLLEDEKHYEEAVSARYIGRKIGILIKDSPEILSRVTNILRENTNDYDRSPMGSVMSFDTLKESIDILQQILLGIEDQTK